MLRACSYRLIDFEEVLNEEVVDIGSLRRICFHGNCYTYDKKNPRVGARKSDFDS